MGLTVDYHIKQHNTDVDVGLTVDYQKHNTNGDV